MGAFGGIMAGVGHISVFGLGDYASSFRKTSPAMNKIVTDSIRTSNQYLVGLSAFMSSVTYYKMGRLVLPLGVALALGGICRGLPGPGAYRRQDQSEVLRGLFRYRRLCDRRLPLL